MFKKIIRILLITLSLFSISLIKSDSAKAQQCPASFVCQDISSTLCSSSNGLFQTCETYDGTYNGPYGTCCLHSGCDTAHICNYTNPDFCNNTPNAIQTSCLQADGGAGNCCMPLTNPYCGPLNVCTGTSTFSCLGTPQSCSKPDGSSGTCCETDTSRIFCNSGENCIATSPDLCNQSGGRIITNGCRSSTSGVLGNCCTAITTACGYEGQVCCTTYPQCQNSSLVCDPETNHCMSQAASQCESQGSCASASPNIYGNCLPGNSPHRTDGTCVRPPVGGTQLDCSNGLDCWCCNQYFAINTVSVTVPITPKPSLNPRCGLLSIKSAIGCIPVSDSNAFLAFILGWVIGISGGIAFILIIVAGFIIITSAGNSEKLKSGKELLTAALSGLLLIIFSVFVLDLLGIRILHLPGL